jgi:formylglycine-generating enzyme
MRVILTSFALLCALTQSVLAITIATVPVGNLGNANDSTGDGGVAYNYAMGKYDITVGQYAEFLNAVAATDTYGLYDPNMSTDLNVAGIRRNGSSGSYTYSVIASANHPITFVSWGAAARFTNWLANGQPTGSEGPSTTETGSYTLNGSVGTNVTRNANATWVIPTKNEWYKAAYYNAANSTYYQYPFSSNSLPTSAPSGSTPNTGNFKSSSGAYAVTGSTVLSDEFNYLTDVGAYSASASPYSAFDMGGDVYQWLDTGGYENYEDVAGGAWADVSSGLKSDTDVDAYLTEAYTDVGFRVALVPEPSTFVLGILAALMLGGLRLRF